MIAYSMDNLAWLTYAHFLIFAIPAVVLSGAVFFETRRQRKSGKLLQSEHGDDEQPMDWEDHKAA